MSRSLEAQVRELAVSFGLADVELRRSGRRKRSVSAFRENGRMIIAAPARIGADELLESARWLLTKVLDKERAGESDSELAARAKALASRYLPASIPTIVNIRWTDSRSTWGSCTSAEGSIRISRALRGMPQWVIDYVIVHELTHLIEANHGPRFYELGSAYPRWEEARSFLEGVSWQAQHGAGVSAQSAESQTPQALDTDALSAQVPNSGSNLTQDTTGSAVNAKVPERVAAPALSTPPALPSLPPSSLAEQLDLFDNEN